jgi:hypothetical protein
MKVRSVPRVLGVCAAIVLVAGCSRAANVTPSQGDGLGQNSSWANHAATDGFAAHYNKDKESLKAPNGSGGQSSCSIHLDVSGKAFGPYHGTFTGSGEFSVCPHQYGFAGGFTITSGATTISGSFDGAGRGGCGRSGCGDGGPLTYKATVGGQTISGKGDGTLRYLPRSADAEMYLTLRSM